MQARLTTVNGTATMKTRKAKRPPSGIENTTVDLTHFLSIIFYQSRIDAL